MGLLTFAKNGSSKKKQHFINYLVLHVNTPKKRTHVWKQEVELNRANSSSFTTYTRKSARKACLESNSSGNRHLEGFWSISLKCHLGQSTFSIFVQVSTARIDGFLFKKFTSSIAFRPSGRTRAHIIVDI